MASLYSIFLCSKCIFICRVEEEISQFWSSWTPYKPKSTPRLPSFTNWKCLKTTSRKFAAWMESAFSTTLFRFSAGKKRPYTLTSPTGLRFCCHLVEHVHLFIIYKYCYYFHVTQALCADHWLTISCPEESWSPCFSPEQFTFSLEQGKKAVITLKFRESSRFQGTLYLWTNSLSELIQAQPTIAPDVQLALAGMAANGSTEVLRLDTEDSSWTPGSPFKIYQIQLNSVTSTLHRNLSASDCDPDGTCYQSASIAWYRDQGCDAQMVCPTLRTNPCELFGVQLTRYSSL